jgi:cardiolipin synthase A/B
MIDDALLTAVQELTLNLPLATARAAAEALVAAPPDKATAVLRDQLHKVFHNQVRYHQIDNLLTRMTQADAPPAAVGYAILAATQMSAYHRQRQRLDLLWTGPETTVIPTRRNDQALLDVIGAARETLYLVSFAVYQIEGIQTAVAQALDRGVQVHLFLELPQRNGETGQVGYNTLQAFGVELALRCWVYEWAMAKRPFRLVWDAPRQTQKKRYAALHAKLAVADDAQLFISSANLTEYAMLHNMEMGVLITGGDEPGRVREHLRALVERGEFALKTKAEIRALAAL